MALTDFLLVQRKVLHRLTIVRAPLELAVRVQVLLEDDGVLVGCATSVRILIPCSPLIALWLRLTARMLTRAAAETALFGLMSLIESVDHARIL